MLIELALTDGELSEAERNYIISIGQANHLMVAEILPLLKEAGGAVDYSTATDNEQLLLELVQLMQIDEKIYREEIRYCANVAARLGFRAAAVFEVMIRARQLGDDQKTLKEALRQYKVV